MAVGILEILQFVFGLLQAMIRVICQPFVFITFKQILKDSPLFKSCFKEKDFDDKDFNSSNSSDIPSPEIVKKDHITILNKKKSLIASSKSKGSQYSHSLNESKNHGQQLRDSNKLK